MNTPSLAIVFDLDGTLVDSWRAHATSLRHAVRAVGLPVPDSAGLADHQRPTDLETLSSLVGEERLASGFAAYRTAFGRLSGTVRPMPGAHALVAGLRGAGVALGVCTGRSRIEAQMLLDSAGLPVPLLTAREDAEPPKPDPCGLLAALRTLDVTPERAVYVGDGQADSDQGARAGVRTYVVGAVTPAPRPGVTSIASLGELPILPRRGQ